MKRHASMSVLRAFAVTALIAASVVWTPGAFGYRGDQYQYQPQPDESDLDNHGHYVNHDLAEYHVATNADIHAIQVIFADEEDRIVSKQLGAKGVGEIGIVGVAAAVANAVFHATGKRLRTTPITPDKVLLGDHAVPIGK